MKPCVTADFAPLAWLFGPEGMRQRKTVARRCCHQAADQHLPARFAASRQCLRFLASASRPFDFVHCITSDGSDCPTEHKRDLDCDLATGLAIWRGPGITSLNVDKAKLPPLPLYCIWRAKLRMWQLTRQSPIWRGPAQSAINNKLDSSQKWYDRKRLSPP